MSSSASPTPAATRSASPRPSQTTATAPSTASSAAPRSPNRAAPSASTSPSAPKASIPKSARRGGSSPRPPPPPAPELRGGSWTGLVGRDALESFVSVNFKEGLSSDPQYWRLEPDGQPTKLLEPTPPQKAVSWSPTALGNPASAYGVSGDGSRVLARLQGGTLDPAHPAGASAPNLYDISAGGDPQLLSFLPGETLASCGVGAAASTPAIGAFSNIGTQPGHWISADGSLLYSPSRGNGRCEGGGISPVQLYLRALDAGETKPISGAPLSGPACEAGFVKATSDVAFFATQTRLSAADSEPPECSASAVDAGSRPGNDVYRYDLGDQSLRCLTCVVPGLPADVIGSRPDEIAVSEAGSRLYFRTATRLFPGAPQGSPGIYRIHVAT